MSNWDATSKRIFDIIFSIIILTMIAPPMLLIAAMLKLESKGSVFLPQTRSGQFGRKFAYLKFRTMHINSVDEDITSLPINSDTRYTRLGAFLRKTSLDELPQFLTVLKGDMSIVGPRPMILSNANSYADKPIFHEIYTMKPGITGWSQICHHKGVMTTERGMDDVFEYDRYYKDNWSLLFDLKIIALTLLEGFRYDNTF